MVKKGPPTLLDVADLAGFHFGTVSRALDPSKQHLVSEKTRHAIAAAANKLGYRANLSARGLRTGQSAAIGFVVADLTNPFLPSILRAAEEEVEAAGFLLVVAETRDEPGELEEVLGRLLARNIDGFIVSSAHYADKDLVSRTSRSTPTVLAIRNCGDSGLTSVGHDDVLGGKIATQHLVDLGHTEVAEVRGPLGISTFRERSKGFRYVVGRAGAANLTPARRDFPPTLEGGVQAAKLLLSGDRLPTALFAHNDMMAIGVIKEFQRAGMNCPSDFSIVGYNDSPLTDRLSPPLSTIRLPGGEVGHIAAEELLSQLRGVRASTRTYRLTPELIIRESACAIH